MFYRKCSSYLSISIFTKRAVSSEDGGVGTNKKRKGGGKKRDERLMCSIKTKDNEKSDLFNITI